MINLSNQDCLKGLPKLPESSIDCVVTSPPYNIGTTYSRYNDSEPRDAYLSWMSDVLYALHRVMTSDASLFLNIGAIPTDPLIPWEVLKVALRSFKLQNTIHWIKAISIDRENGVVSYGHYKPINSPRFVNDCHEFIFHLTKEGNVPLSRHAVGVPYQDESNAKRYNGKGVRCRGNTWFIPYETIQKRDKERPHPATFPIELPRRCFKLHGIKRINLALDPFVGIGSSALAAQKLGIDFVGYEIDHDYWTEAKRRVETAKCEVLHR